MALSMRSILLFWCMFYVSCGPHRASSKCGEEKVINFAMTCSYTSIKKKYFIRIQYVKHNLRRRNIPCHSSTLECFKSFNMSCSHEYRMVRDTCFGHKESCFLLSFLASKVWCQFAHKLFSTRFFNISAYICIIQYLHIFEIAYSRAQTFFGTFDCNLQFAEFRFSWLYILRHLCTL